jgi:hypothetical protein
MPPERKSGTCPGVEPWRVSATIRRDQACSRSEAGKRSISLPEGLRGDIEIHLSRYAQAGPTGRLFVGPQGGIPAAATSIAYGMRR